MSDGGTDQRRMRSAPLGSGPLRAASCARGRVRKACRRALQAASCMLRCKLAPCPWGPPEQLPVPWRWLWRLQWRLRWRLRWRLQWRLPKRLQWRLQWLLQWLRPWRPLHEGGRGGAGLDATDGRR